MRMPVNAGILGVGMAVPDKVLSNADLERMVETNDEWITTRTGIKERRICSPEETSSTLGILAARRALADAGRPASRESPLVPDYLLGSSG